VAPSRLRLVWVDAHGERHSADVAGPTRLGRAPECEIVLDEEGVSRIHCEVRPDGDCLAVSDLHSTNGTFVNGSRVQAARLQEGATIVIGRLLLRVETQESPPEAYKTCSIDPAEIELAIDAGSAYLPHGLPQEVGQRHLLALYGILRVIGDSSDVAQVLQGALRTILDALPLEFGHVLIGPPAVAGAPPPELHELAAHAKQGAPPPWSRTVVRRVVTSGQAVLANDMQSEPELRAAKSIVAAKSLRIACAPIPLRGRTGVLYVASRGLGGPLQSDDVAFLGAAARQIGLAADALAERQSLARENEQLRRFAPARRLVGSSEPMERLREMVAKAAQVDATVLVTGESGTGKELVARGIHEQSPRAAAPFVAVNCGALPANVVTSELFGHEKGAFTGAHARRIGLVEMAHGGTLFLDEIGELTPEVQVMLLRLLEEKRLFRVGGDEEKRVDVRFVAATNRDLEALAAKGAFRVDLLFRLKVVEVRTPPLRERTGDLAELSEFLLAEIARASGRAPRPLSHAALEALRRHSWPGNVRELRNALERALLLSSGPKIEPGDLGLSVARAAANGSPRLVSLADLERDHIRGVLDATGWNKTKAAEVLGVARITLYEKIRGYALEPGP